MLSINHKWRFLVEAGTRLGIERERNGIELVLEVNLQAQTLGHILTYQVIGVLVGTALSRAVRDGEIDLCAGAFGQYFMGIYLAALVVRHGLAHGR